MKALADDIEEDYGRVRKWFQRGSIPKRVWPDLIRKSADFDNPLTAEILLRLDQPRSKRARRSQAKRAAT